MLTTNRISALIDPDSHDLPAARPEPAPPTNPQAPAPSPDLPADRPADDLEPLLLDYIDAALPLEGLANRHNLSLSRLLEIVSSPAFLRRLEALEAASARRAKAIARAGLTDAAFVLRQITARCVMSDDLHEPARKAASKIFALAAPDEDAAPDEAANAPRKPRRPKARSNQAPSPNGAHVHRATSNGAHPPPPAPHHREPPASGAPDGAHVTSPGRSESAAGGRSEPGVPGTYTAEPPNGGDGAADIPQPKAALPGAATNGATTNGAAHNGRFTPLTISAPRSAKPEHVPSEPPDLRVQRKLSLIRPSRDAPASESRRRRRGANARPHAQAYSPTP